MAQAQKRIDNEKNSKQYRGYQKRTTKTELKFQKGLGRK